jgi:hypothetical protein
LFLVVSILAKSEKYSDELSEQTLVEEMDEMDGNGCSWVDDWMKLPEIYDP